MLNPKLLQMMSQIYISVHIIFNIANELELGYFHICLSWPPSADSKAFLTNVPLAIFFLICNFFFPCYSLFLCFEEELF